jgi:hypothetical protein
MVMLLPFHVWILGKAEPRILAPNVLLFGIFGFQETLRTGACVGVAQGKNRHHILRGLLPRGFPHPEIDLLWSARANAPSHGPSSPFVLLTGHNRQNSLPDRRTQRGFVLCPQNLLQCGCPEFAAVIDQPTCWRGFCGFPTKTRRLSSITLIL